MTEKSLGAVRYLSLRLLLRATGAEQTSESPSCNCAEHLPSASNTLNLARMIVCCLIFHEDSKDVPTPPPDL